MKHNTGRHYLSAAGSLLVATLLSMGAGVSPAHASGGFSAGFQAPSGVAIDRHGSVFVADQGNHRVVVLSAQGRVLRTWAAGCDRASDGLPDGLALDRLGSVYVTDAAHNCVLKYSSGGHLLAQFGSDGDGEFLHPAGVAVGGRGNIFVANTDKHSIEKLSPSGYVLATWETDSSDGSGELLAPQGIALDAAGNIYIVGYQADYSGADYVTGSFEVEKRGSDGELLTEWSGLSAPGTPLNGLAVGGRGNVFVGDNGQGHIIKLSPSGQKLNDWHSEDLLDPYAIAVDRRGNMYITDHTNACVVKLSSSGRELAVWR